MPILRSETRVISRGYYLNIMYPSWLYLSGASQSYVFHQTLSIPRGAGEKKKKVYEAINKERVAYQGENA